MNLTVRVIKNTITYFWDELLVVVAFNFLTVLALAGGAFGLWLGLSGYVPLILIGFALLLFAPAALFGLYWLMWQISKGNAVKFTTYFSGAKALLKPAYIWGGINLAAAVLLISNIVFYWNMGTSWSIYAAMFFVGLALLWFCVQLLALTFYPRLVDPTFKLAQRNALALIAMQPGLIVAVLLLSLIVLAIGLAVQLAGFLVSLSLTVLLVNITTEEILKKNDE